MDNAVREDRGGTVLRNSCRKHSMLIVLLLLILLGLMLGLVILYQTNTQAMNNIQSAFDEGQTKLDVLKTTINRMKSVVNSFSTEIYIADDGSIFGIEISPGRTMMYNATDAKCTKHNMVVANIKNEQEYDVIVKILRARIPKGKFNVYIWIGTTIDLTV
uniref:uncharacterized protein LOC120325779 n=1 Tax=Styela clava TaxID=7725 RepID=UPI0019398E35|nr:uncharacterized protein LOC120325779 [Styela clava]